MVLTASQRKVKRHDYDKLIEAVCGSEAIASRASEGEWNHSPGLTEARRYLKLARMCLQEQLRDDGLT